MDAPAQALPWWLPSAARIAPLWWLVAAILLLWGEAVWDVYERWPLLYFIPVCLAAWYSGWRPALALTVGMPVAGLGLEVLDGQPVNMASFLATNTVRTVVIGVVVLWLDRMSEHERALQVEVRTLRGRLLPICSFCKSIKNNAGEWERLERFLAKRSQTQFSHGVCPACREVHYFGMGADD